ncbi:hypothetical protein GCM10023314_05530 [Algibacter agarivorans]|uniref:Uncharacterized protein n=1 Tax=Algibacter agarivorans TaxID=1109741 RepID=A0ABP9GBE8_9FLAO
METLINETKEIGLKKQIKMLVASTPSKLEFLINEELGELFRLDVNVLDIKYAINKDIGSAIIIYQSLKV